MSKWKVSNNTVEIGQAMLKYKYRGRGRGRYSACWMIVDEELNPICTVNATSRHAKKHMAEIVKGHNNAVTKKP